MTRKADQYADVPKSETGMFQMLIVSITFLQPLRFFFLLKPVDKMLIEVT